MRQHRTVLTAVFALACALQATLLADTINLKDGSLLHGKVTKIDAGKLTLSTTYAGAITIDMKSVASLTTDESVYIGLASGSVLQGTLKESDGKLSVATANGDVDISHDTIDAAWLKGDQSPQERAVQARLRKWHYEASLDLNGRTGNTERFSSAGGLKALLQGPDDRLLLYARGQRVTDNGDTTSRQVVGGIDYEQIIAGRSSWYTRAEFEYDAVKDLNLRSTAAAGYGYYFLKDPDHELRGRIGLFYRDEDHKVAEDTSTGGLDLGLHHMLKLGDWGRMVNDLTYTPSVEDMNSYRIYHESSLEFPLRNDRLKVQLGVSNEYVSPSPGDTKPLDTTYFARLVLSWE